MAKRRGQTTIMTISVPTQILAQMRKRKGVNWSRIAAAAFAQELSEGNLLPLLLVENKELRKLLDKIAELATINPKGG